MKKRNALYAWRKAQKPKMSLERFGNLFEPPVNKSTVLRWEREVPADRMEAISNKTGLSPVQLRPDLFSGMHPSIKKGSL